MNTQNVLQDGPQTNLLFDWNEVHRRAPVIKPGFRLVDETLRDGIQSPSVRNPSIEGKLELLHHMVRLGIDCVDVGLPGAGARAVADVTRLVEEIRDQKLPIRPNCAARTHHADIQAVVDISQHTGVAVEVCAFLGCSPMRRLIENWDLPKMCKLTADAVDLGVKNGLPVAFVTEDTIRSDPPTLRELFLAAIEHGAKRLVLTDTVGHATPDGARNLIQFTKEVIAETGEDVEIDWHGHNDRGLSLTLCLSALENGVNRVHGTVLGVGERVGNAPLDLLLLNLKMLGVINRDLRGLKDYVMKVSELYRVPIPHSYPAFGADAFRTATGVHAAAIAKAMAQGREDLADRVYSSIPASEIGCEQIVEIGFYSGKANVVAWLAARKLPSNDDLVNALLDHAKGSSEILTEAQIMAIYNRFIP